MGLIMMNLKNYCAIKDCYFRFNSDTYKQIDGVAMGSPLGPSLANAFLCYYEKNGLIIAP